MLILPLALSVLCHEKYNAKCDEKGGVCGRQGVPINNSVKASQSVTIRVSFY